MTAKMLQCIGGPADGQWYPDEPHLYGTLKVAVIRPDITEGTYLISGTALDSVEDLVQGSDVFIYVRRWVSPAGWRIFFPAWLPL